ncbi:leucoanthocyanidin reductase, partial [Sarracenia purpurea var. burkii]
MSAETVAADVRTLIVGSTGFIGRFVAEASLNSGRRTFILVRSGPVSPSTSLTITSLKDKGAIVIP